MENVTENTAQTTELTLIDLVRRGTKARFSYFRDGIMFYNIEVLEGDLKGNTYQLRINPEDFNDTDLNRTENSAIFMRWIREELKNKRINRIYH